MTKFGYQVLTLKLQCCQGQFAWFPMVTISAAALAYNESPPNEDKRLRPVPVCCLGRFASYDIKGRQVASGNEASCRDNNTILALKPGDQTLSRLTQLIIVV